MHITKDMSAGLDFHPPSFHPFPPISSSSLQVYPTLPRSESSPRVVMMRVLSSRPYWPKQRLVTASYVDKTRFYLGKYLEKESKMGCRGSPDGSEMGKM